METSEIIAIASLTISDLGHRKALKSYQNPDNEITLFPWFLLVVKIISKQ